MPEVLIHRDKIHYIDGESFNKSHPTLLFIHGAGQSHATWRLQEDIFTNHPEFNFIAIDLPGHGSSDVEVRSRQFKNIKILFSNSSED